MTSKMTESDFEAMLYSFQKECRGHFKRLDKQMLRLSALESQVAKLGEPLAYGTKARTLLCPDETIALEVPESGDVLLIRLGDEPSDALADALDRVDDLEKAGETNAQSITSNMKSLSLLEDKVRELFADVELPEGSDGRLPNIHKIVAHAKAEEESDRRYGLIALALTFSGGCAVVVLILALFRMFYG